MLGPPTDGWLADVGGGTGRVASALRDLVGRAVVVDLSEAMLRQAAGKDRLYLVCAQAEALPFPDASFARVIVVDSFHHFADQAAAAREVWRVLAPGGRLVVEEPDIRCLAVRLVALLERLLGFGSRFRTPREIAGAFAGLGARVVAETTDRFVVRVAAEKPPEGQGREPRPDTASE